MTFLIPNEIKFIEMTTNKYHVVISNLDNLKFTSILKFTPLFDDNIIKIFTLPYIIKNITPNNFEEKIRTLLLYS